MWPQYTVLVIYLLGLGISIGEHGRVKTKTENAVITLIAILINFYLLSKGGFFKGM